MKRHLKTIIVITLLFLLLIILIAIYQIIGIWLWDKILGISAQ